MTFLRVILFSIGLLGFYAVYAHILPQVEPDLSEPVEISTDGLDMDGMIGLGESLFSGKGTCTLCHNGMGRAPDTLEMDLAATFPERLSDPRYTGIAAGGEGAKAVEDYIRESLLHPSAYVVAGYGKKGTNDTVSPMPIVDQPPIELNNVEMNAVIAFLQDRAGLAPTVPLPSADDIPADQPASAEGMVEAPVTTAQEAINKYGCSACHDLYGSGADLGPALGGIGGRMTRAEVMGAILDPDAALAEGYGAGLMPADFGDQMHASELLLITDYLLTLPAPDPSESPADTGPATDAAGVIDDYGCAGCHDLNGSGADLGPPLAGIGARLSREDIKQAIIAPNDTIADGYEPGLMPDYYGDDMSAGEMTLLLDYLTTLPE
ncbi:MAG TPA: c-type cytochrome [Aliiroseovarius sp.]|nr:c-type cytochrome [Aliiroseovarius sp.]